MALSVGCDSTPVVHPKEVVEAEDVQIGKWPKEPQDFKGLKFGMSLNEARQAAGKNWVSEGQLYWIKTDLLTFNLYFKKGKLVLRPHEKR